MVSKNMAIFLTLGLIASVFIVGGTIYQSEESEATETNIMSVLVDGNSHTGQHILVDRPLVSFNCSPTTWNGLTFSGYDDPRTFSGIQYSGTPLKSGSTTVDVTLNGVQYTVTVIAYRADNISVDVGHNYTSTNGTKYYGIEGTSITSTAATVSTGTWATSGSSTTWNDLTISVSVDSNTDRYEFSYTGTPLSSGAMIFFVTYEGAYYYMVTMQAVVSDYTVTINVNNSAYGSVSQSSLTVSPGSAITINGAQLTIDGQTVTATPAAGVGTTYYLFNNWSNASGTVTANRTITANFTMETDSGSSYDVTLSPGQTWTYTPAYSPPGATLSISGESWMTLNTSTGTITAVAPNVNSLSTYTLTITVNSTNPTQTATQTVNFRVVPTLTASASPATIYLVSGGPIPNSVSESVNLTYNGFGTGTYTWSLVSDGGLGIQIASDGTVSGTCNVAPTTPGNPIVVTVRITGTVSGYTQTDDVTFNVVVVAKLVFTSNPLTDAVIS